MGTTSLGATTIVLPRARVDGADGSAPGSRSRLIPHYQWCPARVDAAILGGTLLAPTPTGCAEALVPMLRGATSSKDAVSRLVGPLREDFAAWVKRDPGSCGSVTSCSMAGIRGCGSCGVQVLVTLSVCANGQRVALDLWLAGAWLDAVRSLAGRNLGAPLLAVIDGNPGLAAALNVQWPKLAIQRCTNRMLWNPLAKTPAHLPEERRGLSADLYYEPQGGGEGARHLPAQVEAALRRGQRQL